MEQEILDFENGWAIKLSDGTYLDDYLFMRESIASIRAGDFSGSSVVEAHSVRLPDGWSNIREGHLERIITYRLKGVDTQS
ncbi:hypothetical protein [Myxococcus phage Mx1]|nr:hypothetical protein [Myxococcus phage Mx1]